VKPPSASAASHVGVLGRAGHHRDAAVVLRRGADHRRAADVDLLDDLGAGARGDRLLERVQVRDQQLERRDAEVGQLLACGRVPGVGQQPACTRGCRVLTRPSRHSGKPVRSSTLVTGTPACSIVRRGAAGGDDLRAGLVQGLGQLGQAGLVVDAEQGSLDRNRVTADPYLPVVADGPALAGHPADRVDEQRALGDLDPLVQCRLVVVIVYRHRRLGEHRARVDALVDQEHGAAGDLHPVREGVPHAVHAGEGR
jgi:hypothetical protein